MYVKTPIGIYDLENSVWFDFEGLCEYDLSHCEYYENNPSECRVSDLLEELCDEFVIVSRKDYEKNFIAYGLDREFLYESVIEHYRNCKCCYGAIWTDKGLIYVAKMNDKGEFELI